MWKMALETVRMKGLKLMKTLMRKWILMKNNGGKFSDTHTK
jgi:hypothetical protein